MSRKKDTKKNHATIVDSNQQDDPSYITMQDVMQLCAFWSQTNADIVDILKINNPEKNIQIVKKSEKAILEIKFINENKEEKIFQIEIKIYE
ncbi:hypothetical protein [Sphingobacterium sp. SYP-B4668]|uniref:hypothetical protein n=1 Tax=Sphingobacterium sp. SYP-B4668 TaxID=2996035 RepID=UPI0022DE5704|nr:hypothetical protein [Sphingobacterium sp. SYP-B4668]